MSKVQAKQTESSAKTWRPKFFRETIHIEKEEETVCWKHKTVPTSVVPPRTLRWTWGSQVSQRWQRLLLQTGKSRAESQPRKTSLQLKREKQQKRTFGLTMQILLTLRQHQAAGWTFIHPIRQGHHEALHAREETVGSRDSREPLVFQTHHYKGSFVFLFFFFFGTLNKKGNSNEMKDGHRWDFFSLSSRDWTIQELKDQFCWF